MNCLMPSQTIGPKRQPQRKESHRKHCDATQASTGQPKEDENPFSTSHHEEVRPVTKNDTAAAQAREAHAHHQDRQGPQRSGNANEDNRHGCPHRENRQNNDRRGPTTGHSDSEKDQARSGHHSRHRRGQEDHRCTHAAKLQQQPGDQVGISVPTDNQMSHLKMNPDQDLVGQQDTGECFHWEQEETQQEEFKECNPQDDNSHCEHENCENEHSAENTEDDGVGECIRQMSLPDGAEEECNQQEHNQSSESDDESHDGEPHCREQECEPEHNKSHESESETEDDVEDWHSSLFPDMTTEHTGASRAL